jgi:DNA repair protein SbcD/Mre11
MRLLHFADLHLGIETYGSFDPSRGLSTRVVDFLDSFDRIVEYAIEHEVDAVLFAGDAFKNRDPSPTLQREFAKRIMRLSQADIPIVLLVGNHDLPSAQSRATHTEVYQVLMTPGVHICRDIRHLDIETRSGMLQIVAVPWVTRSMFLADESFRIVAQDDLDGAMSRAVSDAVRSLVSELDRNHPAVLLAHLSVQGASFGFERSIMLGRDLTVGIDDIEASAFDYVALGHIHKHQQVIVRPPAVYAGSPERVDFGEEHEAKGFVDVRITTDGHERRVDWSFVELPARRFHTMRIDASSEHPMQIIERQVRAESGTVDGAVVRCYVQVETGQETSVSSLEIRRLLIAAGAAHVARVVIESEALARPRIEMQAGDEFDSATMLRRWVDQKGYKPDFAEQLIEKGRGLIERHSHGSGREAGESG